MPHFLLGLLGALTKNVIFFSVSCYFLFVFIIFLCLSVVVFFTNAAHLKPQHSQPLAIQIMSSLTPDRKSVCSVNSRTPLLSSLTYCKTHHENLQSVPSDFQLVQMKTCSIRISRPMILTRS